MKWTDDRCAELDALFRLLCEVQSINRGSNAVGRILECEQLAKQLYETNLESGRMSFHQFLKELALEDRSNAANNEVKEGS